MRRSPFKPISALKKAVPVVFLLFALLVPCSASSDDVGLLLEDQNLIIREDGSAKLVLSLDLSRSVSMDSYEFSISYDGSVLSLQESSLKGSSSDIRLEVVEGNERIIGVSTAVTDIETDSLGTLTFDILKKGTATIAVAQERSWINRMATTDTTTISGSECTVEVACEKPGDINDDDVVDLLDIVRLMKYFSLSGVAVADSSVDTNADGTESAADIIRLAQYVANPTEVVIY